MAIVSANEQAGRTRNVNALAGFKREYVRRWVVESDTPYEDPVTVSIATGIPNLGDYYPTDDRAYVVNKRTNQSSSEAERKKWLVEVQYSTLDRDAQKNLRNHPLSRPYEVSWAVRHFQRVAEKDIEGKAILNSAGQYFDPPVQIDDSRPVLTITRAEPTFTGAIATLYVNAINNDPFFGGAAFTVKCVDIRAQRIIEEFEVGGSTQEVIYWMVTYEFEYRHETWKLDILDQGRSKKVGTKLVPIPQYDTTGTAIPDSQVTDPVPLDGSGGELSDPTPDNAVYLTKRVYRELDFSAFNF